MKAITSSRLQRLAVHQCGFVEAVAVAVAAPPPKEDRPSALRKMASICVRAGEARAVPSSETRLAAAADDTGRVELTFVARNMCQVCRILLMKRQESGITGKPSLRTRFWGPKALA